jgi:hypothetical protein
MDFSCPIQKKVSSMVNVPLYATTGKKLPPTSTPAILVYAIL